MKKSIEEAVDPFVLCVHVEYVMSESASRTSVKLVSHCECELDSDCELQSLTNQIGLINGTQFAI